MSLIGEKCGPSCGCKCKHGPPRPRNAEADRAHMRRAMALCTKLGHHHGPYGSYCTPSWDATGRR